MARAILKEVADETGYGYGYVRKVNAGIYRNEQIEQAIYRRRSEQLAELSRQIRHEAVTDFNEPSKTEVQ